VSAVSTRRWVATRRLSRRCFGVLGGMIVLVAVLGVQAVSAAVPRDASASDRALLQRATYLADQARLGLASAPYELPWAGVGLPSAGSPKVFALLISFSDYPPKATAATMSSRLFGDGFASDYPYDSLRNWYRRSSYGKLDIQGAVLGWYDAGQPRASVTDIRSVILSALRYYDPTTDFRQFDNNGDGRIDYFLVLSMGTSGGFTTEYWVTNPPALVLDGKRLGCFSTQGVFADWQGVRVPIHETGHALGLPDVADVYRDDDLRGGAGGLDQMDSYGDLSGFFKWVLGWITPQVCSGGPARYALAPSGTDPDALVVMPGATAGKPFTEFFLVQNRSRVGNDADKRWPADGLLVWHVDGRLNALRTLFAYNNSVGPHKLVRLMEADGLEEIDTTGRIANAGDFYEPGDIFGAATRPSSDSYYQPGSTGVWVGDISASGASYVLTASANGAPPLASASSYTFSANASSGWRNVSQVPVTVTGGTGIGRTVHYSLDGGATWGTAGGGAVLIQVTGEGPHHVLFYASDSGSVEANHDAGYVNLDTLPPTPRAVQPVSVKRYETVRLRFLISDGRLGCGRASVTIRIQKGSRTAQTLTTGPRATNIPLSYSFRVKLPKGTYSYYVSATDIAGNASTATGSRFVVK
jgi:M6 family metalloprotease-like protein